jgi:queuine tRNA-ribosyltransferase
MFEHLRDESLAGLNEMGFHGIAIGGLSVGEPKEDMMRILAHTGPKLPENKPHYLMGVGTPEDLVAGVANGIDMFDCVMPTRNARNGWIFTRFGDVKIKNARYKKTKSRWTRPVNVIPAKISRVRICITAPHWRNSRRASEYDT